jgi:hypothetical protein
MDKVTDIKETLLNFYFYPIGNHHTIIICGTSSIRHDIEECLKKGASIKDIKVILFKMLSSVEQIETRAWQAHQGVDKLKENLHTFIQC